MKKILIILCILSAHLTFSQSPLVALIANSIGDQVTPPVPNDLTYVFDGTSTAYMTTDFDLNGLNTVSFAIEAKFATGVANALNLVGTNSSTRLWFRFNVANELAVQLYDTGGITNLTTSWTNDGLDHVFGFSYDGTNLEISVDGVQVGFRNDPDFTGWAQSRPLEIGAVDGATGTLHQGTMKTLQIYNVGLSLADFLDLTADMTNTKSGLVANFAGQKTETTWTDEVGGYIATDQGGVYIEAEYPVDELYTLSDAMDAYSETNSVDVGWVASSATFSSIASTDTDNYMVEIVSTSVSFDRITYNVPVEAGKKYHFSIRAESGSGTDNKIKVEDNLVSNININITGGWTTYNFTAEASTTGNTRLQLCANNVSGAIGDITNVSSVSIIEDNSTHYLFDGSATSLFTTDFDMNGMNDNTFLIRAKIIDDSTERAFVGSAETASMWLRYREDPTLDIRYDNFSTSSGFVTWANDGLYHDFAMSWDSATTTIKIFVDGVELYTEVDGGFIGWDYSDLLKIGARFSTNLEVFDGEMTDIQIYDNALSEAQLLTLHNDITATQPGLLANFAGQKGYTYWTDEVTGKIADNVGAVAYYNSIDNPELVVDPEFSASTNWTESGVTIASGVAQFDVVSGGYIYVLHASPGNPGFVDGNYYRMVVEVQGDSGNQFRVRDNTNDTGGLNTTNGVFTLDGTKQTFAVDFPANANSTQLAIERQTNTGTYSFSVESISVRQLDLDEYEEIIFFAENSGYTLPSPENQILQRNLIDSLKVNGIWDEEDIFYVAANDGSREFATINWKDPNNYQLTEIGTVNWFRNKGFQTDYSLTPSAMNTHWHPEVNAVNFALTDASVNYYVWQHDRARSDDPVVTRSYSGGFQWTGSGSSMELRSSRNYEFNFKANGTNTEVSTEINGFTNEVGQYLGVVRDDSQTNNSNMFSDGVNILGEDKTAIAFNQGTYTWYIGGTNYNGNVPDAVNSYGWGSFSAGSGQYDLQDEKRTIIEAYMDDLEGLYGGKLGFDNEYKHNTTTPTADVRGQQWTATEDMYITDVSVFKLWADNTTGMQVGVYSDNNDSPETLLGSASFSQDVRSGWNSFPLTEPLLVESGTKIWLSYGAGNIDIRYSSAGGAPRFRSTGTFSSYGNQLPSTIVATDVSNFDYALFAEYASAPLLVDFDVQTTTIGVGTLSNNVGADWTVSRPSAATYLYDSRGVNNNPELITNGDFTLATEWVTANGTTITGGEAVLNSTDAWGYYLRQTVVDDSSMIDEFLYVVDWEIAEYTSGGVRVAWNTTGSTDDSKGPERNAVGVYSDTLRLPTGTARRLVFATLSQGATMKIDNVSIKMISDGTMFYAVNDEARIQDGKMLIEPERTNYMTYSEDITNAAWDADNAATVLADQHTAPDGSLTADQFVIPSANAIVRNWADVTGGAANKTMTYSAWIRSTAGASRIYLRNDHEFILANNIDTFLDVDKMRREVTTVTNGAGGGGQGGGVRFFDTSATGVIWGNQIEEGADATSYIPTTTTAVTRAADVITMTATEDWYVTEWLDGVEQTPYTVLSGNTLTMKNGTTKLQVRPVPNN